MKFLSLIYGITADLVIRHLPNFKKDKDCFVFLAHPRTLEDAMHKFPFLKILPKIVDNSMGGVLA